MRIGSIRRPSSQSDEFKLLGLEESRKQNMSHISLFDRFETHQTSKSLFVPQRRLYPFALRTYHPVGECAPQGRIVPYLVSGEL